MPASVAKTWPTGLKRIPSVLSTRLSFRGEYSRHAGNFTQPRFISPGRQQFACEEGSGRYSIAKGPLSAPARENGRPQQGHHCGRLPSTLRGVFLRRRRAHPLQDRVVPNQERCGLHRGARMHLTSPVPSTASTIASRNNHPWTNGQVERMNRTIKDATFWRFFYATRASLRAHLATFPQCLRLREAPQAPPRADAVCCQLWTEQRERFRLNPLHHMRDRTRRSSRRFLVR